MVDMCVTLNKYRAFIEVWLNASHREIEMMFD